jgi:hypothetical protein
MQTGQLRGHPAPTSGLPCFLNLGPVACRQLVLIPAPLPHPSKGLLGEAAATGFVSQLELGILGFKFQMLVPQQM